jgi:hypothetical protein
VPKDIDKAVRLLQAASLADNVDAEVEYAIALFNGTGTPKNQAGRGRAAAQGARQNSPIAQKPPRPRAGERTGAPVDKIEGLKWHLVAKTAGKGDPELDERSRELSPEDRAKVEAAARKWTGTRGTAANDALTAARQQGTQSLTPDGIGPFPSHRKLPSCCIQPLSTSW